MKNLIIAMALVMPYYFLHAQENAAGKTESINNEAGINLLSCIQPYIYNQANGNHLAALTGMYYKHYFGKNAIRAAFNYGQSDLNELGNIPFKNDRFVKQGLIMIGYQRSFGKKKLTGFVFADAVAGFEHDKGSNWYVENYTGPGEPGIVPPNESFDNHALEAGMLLGLGMRYRLTPHLALSYEGAFNFSGSMTKLNGDYFTTSISNQPKGNNFNYGLSLNPLKQLGLAYVF